jgi:hypothetical protein
MRFFAGIVVGIVIGRPVLSVVNEHLTPPVRRKIVDSVNSLAQCLNERIENPEQEDQR